MKKDFKKTLKEFKDINSKLLKQTLKSMLSEGEFQAISKKSGEVVDFKSKEARDAAIKSGTHDDLDKKKGDNETEKPSTNLSANDFVTPAEKAQEPQPDTPTELPQIDLENWYDNGLPQELYAPETNNKDENKNYLAKMASYDLSSISDAYEEDYTLGKEVKVNIESQIEASVANILGVDEDNVTLEIDPRLDYPIGEYYISYNDNGNEYEYTINPDGTLKLEYVNGNEPDEEDVNSIVNKNEKKEDIFNIENDDESFQAYEDYLRNDLGLDIFDDEDEWEFEMNKWYDDRKQKNKTKTESVRFDKRLLERAGIKLKK